MRIVHSNKSARPDLGGLSRDQAYKLGIAAEKEGDRGNAEFIYLAIVRQHPSYEPAYSRLMVLYRKEKEYNKEINTIDKAIEMTLSAYIKTSRLKVNPKISKLSTLLAKSTGLNDKKGKPVHEPEIVTKWRKRRAVAEARMKKNAKAKK